MGHINKIKQIKGARLLQVAWCLASPQIPHAAEAFCNPHEETRWQNPPAGGWASVCWVAWLVEMDAALLLEMPEMGFSNNELQLFSWPASS